MENYREFFSKFLNILKSQKKVFFISLLFLIVVVISIKLAFFKNTYKTSFFIKAITFDDIQKRVPKLSNAETEKMVKDFNYFIKYNLVNNNIAPNFDTISLSSLRNDDGALEVIMEIYDTNSVTVIKNLFIKYLNENKYIKEGMAILKKEYDSLITNFSLQIANLNNQLSRNKNFNFNFNIYNDLANLKEKKIAAESFIKNNKGFVITVEPGKPILSDITLPKFIILTTIFSFFISLLIAFISYLFFKQQIKK